MQNRINDQPAFILHRRDFQDSSLILEIFSEDYGRLSVLAKGARKRRGVANFQLFNRLSVGWTGRSELKILTHIESRPLAIHPDCYLALFYINELLLHLLPKQDEHRGIFQRYQSLLLQMEQQQMEALLRGFELYLLTQLGLMPTLLCESAYGQSLDPARYYCVDQSLGVRPAKDGENDTFSGAELYAIQQQKFDSSSILLSARRLLRQIIDFNLQGRTLQSRKIYQQIKMKQ